LVRKANPRLSHLPVRPRGRTPQIISNPTHMVIMAALMAGLMAAAMMLMR
jgi:hypothetical protein